MNLYHNQTEWDPKHMHDDPPEYEPLDDGETETTFGDEDDDLDHMAAAQDPDPEDYDGADHYDPDYGYDADDEGIY